MVFKNHKPVMVGENNKFNRVVSKDRHVYIHIYIYVCVQKASISINKETDIVHVDTYKHTYLLTLSCIECLKTDAVPEHQGYWQHLLF